LDFAVYRFVAGDRVLYVGSAKRLRPRMRTHRSNALRVQTGQPKSPHHIRRYGAIFAGAGDLGSLVVEVLTLADHAEALRVERQWINQLKPVGNREGKARRSLEATAGIEPAYTDLLSRPRFFSPSLQGDNDTDQGDDEGQ
jgi:excinuclease UvrABC nuclease subunit